MKLGILYIVAGIIGLGCVIALSLISGNLDAGGIGRLVIVSIICVGMLGGGIARVRVHKASHETAAHN